jgi:hypothetical protein
MTSFKEYYLLEYAKKENALHSGLVSLKSGINGKSYDRMHMRKNVNTVKKEYKPRHNIPTGVISGADLINLLNSYDLIFEPGKTKSLGNFTTNTVEMYIGQDGQQYGKVTTK